MTATLSTEFETFTRNVECTNDACEISYTDQEVQLLQPMSSRPFAWDWTCKACNTTYQRLDELGDEEF